MTFQGRNGPASSSIRKRTNQQEPEKVDPFLPIQKAIFHLGDKHPTMTLDEDIQRTSEVILSSFGSHADSIVECCTSCIIELPHKLNFLCTLILKIAEDKPGFPEQVIRECFSVLKKSLTSEACSSWRHSSQILRFFSACVKKNLLSCRSLELLVESFTNSSKDPIKAMYSYYLSMLTPFPSKIPDNLILPRMLEQMSKFSNEEIKQSAEKELFSLEMKVEDLVVDPCWDFGFFFESTNFIFKEDSSIEDQFYIVYDIRHLIEGMECNHRKCADVILNSGCDPSLLEKTLIEGGDDKGKLVATLLLKELMRNRRNRLNEIVYETLLLDCCRLSSTFPRSMAQSLQALMDGGMNDLDHSSIDRLANWFSLHLSNFDFKWNWNKWSSFLVEDGLEVDTNTNTNQLLFITLVLRGILNLSYRERILGTLPEAFHPFLPVKEVVRFSEDTSEMGIQITKVIMEKGSGEDILKISNDSSNDSIVINCIFKFGSKSRTYMLAIIEKYLSLLKIVEGRSPYMILGILDGFWGDFGTSSSGMAEFVIEKLISYRIIMPLTVIEWFIRSGKCLSTNRSLVMGTLRQSFLIPRMAEEKMKFSNVGEEKILSTVNSLKEEFNVCLRTFYDYLDGCASSSSIYAFKEECEFAFS